VEDKTLLVVSDWIEFDKEEIKQNESAIEVGISAGWHATRVRFRGAPLLVCLGIMGNDASYLNAGERRGC
jgi:hypothetical protein